MDITYNPIPGVDTYSPNMNPTLISPNSTYTLPFYQTRESLTDMDVYRSFLKNIESRFRHSVRYTNYKSFLYSCGFDHCQIHGFINKDMASIEMHHAILTLFDIAMMMTEHTLNTVGYVTTFDIVQLLKEEHSHHNIPLVMMTVTPHQVYHNDSSFYIHPSMCIGKWQLLLKRYMDGLTQDLAFKVLYYLNKAIDTEGTNDSGLLDLRDQILSWSDKNV